MAALLWLLAATPKPLLLLAVTAKPLLLAALTAGALCVKASIARPVPVLFTRKVAPVPDNADPINTFLVELGAAPMPTLPLPSSVIPESPIAVGPVHLTSLLGVPLPVTLSG